MNGKPRAWPYTSNVQCDSVRLHVISSRFWPLGAPGCQALAHCCAQRPCLAELKDRGRWSWRPAGYGALVQNSFSPGMCPEAREQGGHA